jgi:dTDP-4-amino-4,6-dideoxygalactose transaminase
MNLRTNPPPIPFIDVAAQRRRLGSAIDAAVARVLNHCQFILGPEVRAFEAELAEFCGARHVVTCASGTDALVLALRAMGIGPGDAVLCPSFTFCATAEVAALVGATPVFVDVGAETFNIDAKGIAGAATAAREAGLKPKAIVPVDLFGLAADHGAIQVAAKTENLLVLDDAAQGFGATYNNRRLGTFGQATATSFFPAGPRLLWRQWRGDNRRRRPCRRKPARPRATINMTIFVSGASRLDTIGGDPGEKLRSRRKSRPQKIARRYGRGSAMRGVPATSGFHWFAQYTIRIAGGRRDAMASALRAEGIPTAIYYPIPLHRQQAYKHFPIGKGGVAVSERLASEVISLPMHAYLDAATQDRIIDVARRALKK